MAQWLAHLPSKQGVAGSSPAKGKPGEAKIGWRRIRIHWGVRQLTLSSDSSVGRAVDCRSIGRVFDSPSLDLKRVSQPTKVLDKVN